MKNNLTLFSLSLVALSFSTSCKKWKDDSHHPHKQTKIEKIEYAPTPSINTGNLGMTTLFNAKGEPLKGIPAAGGSTENPYLSYQYDAKGRLRYWIKYFDFFGSGEPSPLGGPANTNNLFVYNAYSFDAKDNIQSDTQYYASSLPYLLQSITTYTYDGQNRLTSSKYVYYDQGTTPLTPEITNYSYDGIGNLVGYTYDDKPSLKSASKVLKFITRDYSVNNRLQSISQHPIAYQYNALGLPVRLEGGGLYPLNANAEGVTTITY